MVTPRAAAAADEPPPRRASTNPVPILKAIPGLDERIVRLAVLLGRRGTKGVEASTVDEILATLDAVAPSVVDEIDGARGDDALDAWVRDVELVITPRDAMVFEEHDATDGYYVLLHGAVAVLKKSVLTEHEAEQAAQFEQVQVSHGAHSPGVVVAMLSTPGASFGDASLCGETLDGHRSASVLARDTTVVTLRSSPRVFCRYMTRGGDSTVRRRLDWVEASLLFATWPPEEQMALAERVRLLPALAQGRFLVQPGEPVTGCFFILSGEIRVSISMLERKTPQNLFDRATPASERDPNPNPKSTMRRRRAAAPRGPCLPRRGRRHRHLRDLAREEDLVEGGPRDVGLPVLPTLRRRILIP